HEVRRRPGQVRDERRLAPGAVLGLRVGFVEQGVEFLRVDPGPTGDGLRRFEGCLGRRPAGRRCGREEAGAPGVVGGRGKGAGGRGGWGGGGGWCGGGGGGGGPPPPPRRSRGPPG